MDPGLRLGTAGLFATPGPGPVLSPIQGEGFERVPLPARWDRAPRFSLAADPKRGVWMGSRNGRVGHWDGRRLEPARLDASAAPGDVQALRWGPGGQLWAMGTRGLQRRD